MCRLPNIAMCDYQESVTTGQTHARQSDPYVPLCFAGDKTSSYCTFLPNVFLSHAEKVRAGWFGNFFFKFLFLITDLELMLYINKTEFDPSRRTIISMFLSK